MDESKERLARAAVLWYWSCVHGAPAIDTPEHQSMWEAIEEIVDKSMDEARVWPKAELPPLDLRRVEVEGYGTWKRIGANLFRHVGDVYKLRSFHRLRELGTVREVRES